MCYMLDAVLLLNTKDVSEMNSSIGTNISQDRVSETSVKSSQVTDEMEAIFISCLYSSLGAPLEGDSRLVFDEFVKKISGLVKIDDSPTKRAGFSKSCIILYFFPRFAVDIFPKNANIHRYKSINFRTIHNISTVQRIEMQYKMSLCYYH